VLHLYVEAPFAAFRTFTTGAYRATATFLTPSAAYGLLLNIARIESRLREEDERFPKKHPSNPRRDPPLNTLLARGLPVVEIAVGVPAFRLRRGRMERLPDCDVFPRVQTVYQQLHSYVGGNVRVDDPDRPGKKTTKEKLGLVRAKLAKWHITPVRREFLSDLRAVITFRGNDDLEERVRRGLTGGLNKGRYGVPFLGDNAFLIDRLEELTEPGRIHWYERITPASGGGVQDRATRLTILIDRADLSKTQSALYSPGTPIPQGEPPANAWTHITPPPCLTVPSPRRSLR